MGFEIEKMSSLKYGKLLRGDFWSSQIQVQKLICLIWVAKVANLNINFFEIFTYTVS